MPGQLCIRCSVNAGYSVTLRPDPLTLIGKVDLSAFPSETIFDEYLKTVQLCQRRISHYRKAALFSRPWYGRRMSSFDY